MKRPTFFEGVAVAVAASVSGAALFAVLTAAFAGGAVLRLLIAGIGLAYVLYLLARSRERVGRVTVVTAYLALAAATWFVAPPLPLYVVAHIGMIWLIRSLYFYSSALSALADLGLTGLSLAAAVWAGIHSHSVFLAIWCFFLVQALFVVIPASWRRSRDKASIADDADRFECAHRVAQAALRRLSSVR